MSTAFAFDWLLEHAARRPSAKAIGTPDGWLDYQALSRRVLAMARAFAEAGVGPEDRVLICLPNVPAAVVASLAAQALGAAAVEVNREWGAEAIGAVLRQTRARHAVVFGQNAALFGALFAQCPPSHAWVVHRAELPPKLVAALGVPKVTRLPEDGDVEGELLDRARLVRDERLPALLVFTSGSTGTPRGVIQTHANVAANTRSIVGYLGLTEADRAMAVLPLFYCYGKSVLQTHLLAGGSVFFDGRFMYPRVVLEAMAQEGCTGFAGVPLTFELLKRQVDVSAVPVPTLRYLTQAGGAMAQATIDWVRRAFAPARLFVMYGQTEATARLSYLPPERGEQKAGSIGIPIPGVELAVVDEAGNALPDGEEGHLVARGENVTPGYFEAPEETAAILRDGWLWTGDLGRRDADGFYFLTGRAKEMLKLGGHRVSALELEHAVAAHPEVSEVAVFGLPDEVGGERAVAVVVRKAGSSLEAEALQAFLRASLPAFKVPKTVRFVDALPRSSAGKVLKAELKKTQGG